MTASYRAAIAEDRPFIVSGWSASQRMTRDVPLISMKRWADVWRPIVGEVLDQVATRVVVVHGAVLQGFIAYQPPLYVLYVYVAQPFRRNGLARGLFAAAGIDPRARFSYACRTKASWECRNKIPFGEYDPFPVRFGDQEKRP